MHRIGRTARLGEEGDAISFACERYAMSLPDIEAYIEQKIPVEAVTAELLTSLPRAARAPVEGEEVDEDAGESVGAIFREAREQKAADEARRGGRDGKPSGSRSGERGADGKPRRERKPRVEGEQAATPAAPKPPRPAAADAPSAAGSPAVEGERAPRKRRRRRHGRPVEGAEGVAAATPNNGPVQVQAKPMRGGSDNDSFLTRLGRKIRRMLSGS
ncbi:ATP-dependent RNA helicase RhlB [compost metagenome]